MASPLQNRIVGTVIIVALAVIFLPDLLDGNKIQRDDELETIPLRPELSTEQQRAQFPEDFEQQIAAAEPAEEALTAVDEESAEPEEFSSPREPVAGRLPQADESNGAPAWVIRLGAFRNAENVNRLVEELQEAGFSAYSRSTRNQSGELNILLVGPDLDAEALRAQLTELQEITGLEGQVVRYQPTPE
ncbi:SPOR domain-containing protein [Aliidiomarina minuta]|uniref:SPOR domain-containing protein n=1 Tax=Aliidiomarina minuta TaxID=880057 RepID=UPI0013003742|nr:SPOR domain-containing protein [Aliidiomarina minuta]